MNHDPHGASPDPLGNPLAHALDDAATWPEAVGYDVPVAAIRRRVRRRRNARRAAIGGGACVLAAGVVVAAPDVWGFLGMTPSSGGAVVGGATASRADGHGIRPEGAAGAGKDDVGSVAGGSAGTADWPAQFDRCGRPLVDPAGATTLALQGSTIAADGTWHATTVARSDDGMTAAVLGTDVSLVRDGVVVAVQEGAQVQQPTGPTTPAPHRQGIYGTETTTVGVHLASCAQYPDGQGSAVVPPGTYELVVVQTLAMTGAGGDWTQHAVARTSVTVPDAG